ncbi:glycoside hydrolase family 18 protein [Stachybotrys elegans]|uniref:Glycoside hydrolase family 18 protein n=1 Tax=Stachybotrys elegans TaxID=80388 RepID=A0A8K0SVW9_9HYPO|nr:glycoside hydrolase family 18 protein [Stachybotrys elegans]
MLLLCFRCILFHYFKTSRQEATMRTLFHNLVFASLAALSLASPALEKSVAVRQADDLPRLVIYYQTTHDRSNNPISMLPLVTEQNIALTHLVVCSFHIQADYIVHLNDFPPDDAHFSTVWEEARLMQEAGVKVIGMVGGAAPGSFTTRTLDSPDAATFEHYYGQLRDIIIQYNLQGMDLDVEQSMSQSGIRRLVERLHADFDEDFEVTLAPVASALRNGANLSGFNYRTLETEAGDKIAFHNAQFYNGFGSMSSTATFDAIVANGFRADKVVIGQLTTPSNGFGFVPFDTLRRVINSLQATYGQIGGVMGWEYFNSQPGDLARPWEWAQQITSILRPQASVNLRITKEVADRLSAAWDRSVAANGEDSAEFHASQSTKPDYHSWINA